MNRIPRPCPPRSALPACLERLRTELTDLACTLDGQGRLDAADLAASVAGRIGELLATERGRRPAAGGRPGRMSSAHGRTRR